MKSTRAVSLLPPDGDLEEGPTGLPSPSRELGAVGLRDWKTNLEASSHVEILDITSGNPLWTEVSLESIEDPIKVPESVEIRLYLVEGVNKEVLSKFASFDDKLFSHHYLNVLPFHRGGFGDRLFFGKWFRRVYQDPQQRFIEERLATGRPYNSDVAVDPQKLGLDHERYSWATCNRRPFSSLDPDSKGEDDTKVAIGECASICIRRVDNATIALIVFDACRRVYIDEIKIKGGEVTTSRVSRECFSYFRSCLQRFKDQLQDSTKLRELKEDTTQCLKQIILRFILDDHMEIMSDFREALDFIDQHLSNDRVLRECLQTWRVLLGQWKRNLSNDLMSLAYAAQSLLPKLGIGEDDRIVGDDALKPFRRTDSIPPPSQVDFDNVTKGVESLSKRAESTFQAMTSTMAIVESREAIAQAATISKLTNLAFVFIPLTFTASLFGMNIVEWDNQLKTWYWILVSAFVLLITYMVLYFEDMSIGLSRSAETMKRLQSMQKVHINRNKRRLSKSAQDFESYRKQFWISFWESVAQRTEILLSYLLYYTEELWESTASIVVVITPIACWAIGIWGIAAKSSLPSDLKVVVAIGFALGIPSVLFLLGIILFHEDEKILRRPALITFPCLLLGLGIGIWAVMAHAPLSYDESVRVAVGMGVGGPCLFLLWILTLRHFVKLAPVLSVLFLIVFIPVLWAVAKRAPWDVHIRVSVCLGLGFSLPCLFMIVALVFLE